MILPLPPSIRYALLFTRDMTKTSNPIFPLVGLGALFTVKPKLRKLTLVYSTTPELNMCIDIQQVQGVIRDFGVVNCHQLSFAKASIGINAKLKLCLSMIQLAKGDGVRIPKIQFD